MNFKKEAKIAVIVSLIILLFFWGYNFLKGRNLFSAFNYYSANFKDVSDLQISNIVTINGFVVGVVSDILLNPENMDSATVIIGVKKSYRIPDNSIMLLNSELLGGKYISLLLGDSGKMLEDGSVMRDSIVPGLIETISGKLLPIADNADKLIVSLDSLTRLLQNTFDSEFQGNVHSIVANVEQMVTSEKRKIGTILSNFESVSGNLKQNNEDISKLIANLNSFSATLAASDVKNTVDNANQSLTKLNGILTNIERGQGTLGKFAGDDSLYIYLQRSSDDLDRLLIDLRENPGDYVHFSIFGGKKTKTKAKTKK